MNATHTQPDASPDVRRPKIILGIGIAILLTTSRLSVIASIPELEMFDGVEPDAWFAPWVSDTILGLLAPLMAYLAIKKTGLRVWGVLVAYNAMGAFDYAHGLATQWTDPQVASPSGGIYAFIGVFFVIQFIVTISLFRSDVASHFTTNDEASTAQEGPAPSR